MAIQIGSGGGDDDGVWWGMEQMPANSIQSSGVQSRQHSHRPRHARDATLAIQRAEVATATTSEVGGYAQESKLVFLSGREIWS